MSCPVYVIQVAAITTATSSAAAAAAAATAAASGQAPEEKSTASLSEDTHANTPTEAAYLDGAVRRVARLLELLGSVGEMEAWAKRVGGDGHSACRRLVDLAVAAGSGVLLSPGGVEVKAAGFRDERWVGCR